MTSQVFLGRHDEVVEVGREDIVGLDHLGRQTDVEAVRHGLDNVRVDGVDHLARVVGHVLPPDVGGVGPGVAAPQVAGRDVVTLAIPRGLGLYQGAASEQII